MEGEAARQFIGDQLVVGWPLQGQEGAQEALNLRGPSLVMVATGGAQDEAGGLLKPRLAEPKQMSPADLQQLGSGQGVELTPIEVVEGLEDELRSETASKLRLLFINESERARSSRARPFVGLRYAPASSGLALEEQSLFERPPVSFCSLPNRENCRQRVLTPNLLNMVHA